MKNIVWKVVLILAVLALCSYAIYPPKEKIRLGKDLRGGTSLIYLVNIPDTAADKQRVLGQTIDVLKERIDPRGILDISMQPLGADRIEIVMPLPSEEVLKLRREYDDALKALLAMAEVDETELDQALRDNNVVARFGGSDPSRASQFEALQKAYNDLVPARQALVDAKASGAAADVLNKLEQAAADAEFAYENARQAVLRSSLDRSRVVRTLGLSTNPEKTRDPVTGKEMRDAHDEPIMGPSPREVALEALKAEFPHLSQSLSAAVAAFDAYQKQRTALDDPEDLMRLLRGAGVLEFHIAVQNSNPQVDVEDLRQQLAEAGPEGTTSPEAAWYPINELKQWYKEPNDLVELEADPAGYFARQNLVAAHYQGTFYLLLYTMSGKAMTHDTGTQWAVEGTYPATDELGRAAVGFDLDPAGGRLMSRMTANHKQQPMAIVLDGQVYSAPNINDQIGERGIIMGTFTPAELEYLTRVLAAGSLEARLSDEPIAINTLGPSLGKDNLLRGMKAFILALLVTAAIMLVYYFFAGAVAVAALMANALIIFGLVGLTNASLTLPGLAGLALSIAMAVDANVLIYERIREEIVNNREDLRTAIRLGYNRALSAIIDGNMTNLIVCVVLYAMATTEVKGFAFTMGWGVVATLFTALFVTRVLYLLYTEYLGARSLPMLATVFPGVHKALEPRINWFGKRHVFFAVSIVACVLSVLLVAARGANMLDTEFRGGLTMTMQTREARPGEHASTPTDADSKSRLLLARPEVEKEVRSIGANAGPDQPILRQLESATVLTVGEMTADFRASRFQIKVGNPPAGDSEKTITDTVVNAIKKQFEDRLDVTPDLTFKGLGDQNHAAYTYPIEHDALGVNINRPEYTQSVARFRGGVAVVFDQLSPPITPQSAETRIAAMRDQPDFSQARSRDARVIGLTAADPADREKGYTSIAVLVRDPNFSKRNVDFDQWDRELAEVEWRLASMALSRGSSLQEIASFSDVIARTLAAYALVAVVISMIGMLIYIWVRFGSLRYSLATITSVIHNVIICLGALALTHWVAGTSFAAMIGLDEFRIDLNVIAALLTIIGYSLNDTIVILDRIRENRGKRTTVTPEIVNNSINQTFSRTVLTGGSTILASVILYSLGGTGIQPFAFTFLVGLLVGTYSSVGIAAPLVIQRPPPAEGPEGRGVSEIKFEQRMVRPGTVAGAPV